MFVHENSTWINHEIAFEVLGISKSCYYAWVASIEIRKETAKLEQQLESLVVLEFIKNKKRYGTARITKSLNKKSISCSYKKVLAIMNKLNLKPIGHQKYKVTTTNSNHKYKVFDNLLERNFTVTKPNQVYVGDITYIRTGEGWLYLATVIDLFSRKIIGYTMSNRMTKDLVISALLKALKSRGYPTNVIVHSDRGSQYASNEYKRILKQHGLLGSMSKKGDCWDNAVAESFFASLKKEYVHQTEFATRAQAKLGIFDYIEAWYNNERIHSKLDGLSPNEFEFLNKEKFGINKIKLQFDRSVKMMGSNLRSIPSWY